LLRTYNGHTTDIENPCIAQEGTAPDPRAVGDCDPNAVITNYAFNPNSPPPVEPGAIDWTIIRNHRGYDQAYTQGISAQYNGTATPEHTGPIPVTEVRVLGIAETWLAISLSIC
jgi:hypothetical protein